MKDKEDLKREEDRRIRMLRISTDLVVQMLMTRPLTTSEAQRIISGVRKLALKLFPGKDTAFDLIYLPRFRRALEEAGASPSGLPAILQDTHAGVCGAQRTMTISCFDRSRGKRDGFASETAGKSAQLPRDRGGGDSSPPPNLSDT